MDFKLAPPARAHLDTIVHQMTTNGEKPENIQNVVNDFKSKYGVDHSGAESVAAGTDPKMKGVSTGLIPNLAKTGKQIAIGAGKGAISTVNSLAVGGQKIQSQTLGRAANIISVKGNKPTPVASVPANVLNTQNKDQRIGYGAEQAAEFIAPFAGSLAEKGAKAAGEAIGKVAEKSAAKDTWELVKPVLTKTGGANAAEAGKLTEGSISGAAKPAVNQEMVNAAKQYVKGAKTPLQAVNQISEGIAKEATMLKNGLKEGLAKGSLRYIPTYYKSEVTSALDKIEKSPEIVGDIEKTYQKVQNKMSSLIKNEGTVDGLLDARQAFDQYVKETMPNLYSSERLSPIKKAVLDIRGTVNKIIDSKLPEGKLPDGTTFRASLRKQSLLFDARTNAAAKIKIGEATSFIGKLGAAAGDYGKKAAGAIVGGGAVAEGIHKVVSGSW